MTQHHAAWLKRQKAHTFTQESIFFGLSFVASKEKANALKYYFDISYLHGGDYFSHGFALETNIVPFYLKAILNAEPDSWPDNHG